MGKDTCMHDSLKIHKIISKIWVEKIFSKKISRKTSILAIFGQKFDKSSEPAELDRRRDACNSAK